MDLKSQLNQAFSGFSRVRVDLDWKRIVYILSSECGWTQKDIFETDIPFIIDYLDGRKMYYDEQKKEMEKQKRKRK